MTTQDVLKLNKAVLDSWNQHDTAKFLSLCDESVVWREIGNPEPFRGKKGAGDFFEIWNIAFPDFTISLLNTIANETSVAAEIEFSGTNTGPMKMGDQSEIPATNRTVTANKGSYFARFNSNGKLTEVNSYPDLAGMMVQLGLIQEPHL